MSLTTTTLNTAITQDAVIVALASTAGLKVGYMLGIDSEILQVTDIIGNGTTSVRVMRGVDGTAAASHAAAATVSLGVPDDFAKPPSVYPTIAPTGTVAVGNGPGDNPTFQTVSSINPFNQSLNTTDAVAFSTVQAAFKSSAGTAGAVITGIQIKNGLVTTLTGS